MFNYREFIKDTAKKLIGFLSEGEIQYYIDGHYNKGRITQEDVAEVWDEIQDRKAKTEEVIEESVHE